VRANLQLLPWQLPLLESSASALSQNWMLLLVGGPASGKTSLARSLAALCGRRLAEVPLTPGTDTSDLLGSFEQVGLGFVWAQGWGSYRILS
jgi:midasin